MEQNYELSNYQLINVREFADIIGVTRISLLQNLHRNPQYYPPIYRISHKKNSPLRFKKQEVMNWIDKNKEIANKSVDIY